MSISPDDPERLLPSPSTARGRFVRLIRANAYDQNAPAGLRITPAALPSSEYQSTPDSKGPSIYLLDKLRNELESLYAENPKWRHYRVAIFTGIDIEFLGLSLEHTPDECPYTDLRDAHFSIIGINSRVKRDELLNMLQNKVLE